MKIPNDPYGREMLKRGELYPVEFQPNTKIRAIWTGEKRNPKKDEYYLSGAQIMAYKAPNDLSTPYSIAKLVNVEKVEYYKIISEV